MNVTRNHTKLELSSVGYDPSRVAFVRSLPDAKLAPTQNVWRVPATACVAWQLQKFGATLSAEAKELAEAWSLPDVESDAPPPEQLTPAWRHQAAAFWFCTNKPAAMLGMEMGTGKSKTTIDLLNHWDCRRVVILCPKVVIGVWPGQFASHSREPWQIVAIDAGSIESKVNRAETASVRAAGNRLAIIVNYESAWRTKLAAWLVGREWDAVVCDESQRIKSPSGAASKFCYRLSMQATRRLCLTGTPLSHSPLDAFGQYRFLDVGVLGSSFVRFRARYAQCNALFPGKVDKWLNQEELTAKMGRIAFRVRTRDVLDLPETIHQQIPVVLEPKSRKVYDDLSSEMLAEIDDGKITAANALAKLLRLQQIAGGWVKLDEEERPRRIGTEKQDALADLIDGIDLAESIVVFSRFRTDLVSAAEAVAATGRRPYFLHGGHNELEQWKAAPDGAALLVQTQAGGLGIDLTKARYCIYYSLGFSLGDYEQSLFRVSRPGQTRTTCFYHLVATDSVDEKVYRALRERKEVVSYVVEALRTMDVSTPVRLAS